jgi:hypothetical protein
MRALEHRPGRTFAVWVVVIGAHVAVILLLGQSRPVVDWDAAAKSAAVRALEDGTSAGKVFGDIAASPYRDCQRRKRSWQWIPERKKSGFSGGLPWVQVSDHCIVGLGFFGCAIGELPPPRGDLLDDMDTSNQLQSTVPGIEDCVEEPPPGG